jgi:hypothetical protein
MRGALADGDLDHPWVLDRAGKPLFQAVVDRDEWKRSGIAPGYGLQTIIDDDLCPGPKALAGLSIGLDEENFEAWLAARLAAPAATSSAPVVPQGRQYEKAYIDYVQKRTGSLKPPSSDDDYRYMKSRFPRITRERVRRFRKEHAPPEWQKPGTKAHLTALLGQA